VAVLDVMSAAGARGGGAAGASEQLPAG
jgi:hypothetical protein